ncbi:MAG: nitrate- and nitrite sensing domain-containing protein, partial [Myxococcales bacterium]|nr:nitrate- and nitrite sensing domain-containing protein [Myxococcales bacterium]
MNNLPVRQKLLLLAGVPVLGAICLSLLIVTSANEQVRKAESLGSVENLAELSKIISALAHELQGERAEATWALGKRHGAEAAANPDSDPVLEEVLREFDEQSDTEAPSKAKPDGRAQQGAGSQDGSPNGSQDSGVDRGQDASVSADAARLRAQYARTDRSEAAMTRFLAERDLSQLPRRLASQLSKARRLLDDRTRMRAQVTNPETSLSAVTEYYGSCLAPLIQATAALTELVDDGELLRLITSLVALMKVKEANAAEHAVVVHALAAGEFAPGAYRQFVTLTTASQSYLDVFRTLANQTGLFDPESLSGEAAEAVAIRDRVSNWLDGPPPASAEAWFLAQASKLRHMRGVEAELN